MTKQSNMSWKVKRFIYIKDHGKASKQPVRQESQQPFIFYSCLIPEWSGLSIMVLCGWHKISAALRTLHLGDRDTA